MYDIDNFNTVNSKQSEANESKLEKSILAAEKKKQHETKNDCGFVYFYRLPILFSSPIKSIKPKMFFSPFLVEFMLQHNRVGLFT